MPQTQTPDAVASSADPLLIRGLRVTWWYTFGGILFFEVVLLFLLVTGLASLALAHEPQGVGPWQGIGILIGGLAWLVATAVQLNEYHRITTTGDEPNRVYTWIALAVAVVFGAFLFATWGLWSAGLIPLAQCVILLGWQPGVRSKVTLAVTALLLVLAVRDGISLADQLEVQDNLIAGWFTLVYACGIPAMSVFSLWWWDVVIRLDQARSAESHLAVTQERLRIATDVHDLQGHHLQVIALQLELTQRMLERDPAAALTHLKEARASVDAARQGTRNLVKPFTGIPLSDEIANAADLLTAAGARVTSEVDQRAGHAPAEVLGPIIRETTTNVLKHGGATWAHLSLLREGSGWRYEISNDVATELSTQIRDKNHGGTGIEGMKRRLSEAGGSFESTLSDDAFSVIVEVRA